MHVVIFELYPGESGELTYAGDAIRRLSLRVRAFDWAPDETMRDSLGPSHLDRNPRALPAQGMTRVRRASQRSMAASLRRCLPAPADTGGSA